MTDFWDQPLQQLSITNSKSHERLYSSFPDFCEALPFGFIYSHHTALVNFISLVTLPRYMTLVNYTSLVKTSSYSRGSPRAARLWNNYKRINTLLNSVLRFSLAKERKPESNLVDAQTTLIDPSEQNYKRV
uniref:Uncharacterized protein n=1 Tax=Glossina pallidipes TaxID=7398 RepID=A0A1A9ZNH9_GLOPL